MVRKFFSHLHQILSKFIFMSKDLNSWPLADSLIRLYLIEDIRSNRQIVPENIKFFWVRGDIFILKNTLLVIANRLRSWILINIVNYLIEIGVVEILGSWIVEHRLNMSYFEAYVLSCLFYHFVLRIKGINY